MWYFIALCWILYSLNGGNFIQLAITDTLDECHIAALRTEWKYMPVRCLPHDWREVKTK